MLDTYTYKAREKSGRITEGKLEAENKELVVSKLREMGYLPVSVEKVANKGLNKEFEIPYFTNRVKPKDVAVMCRQLATMVDSGMTLLRALAILGVQTESKGLAKVVAEVRMDIERGLSFSGALSRHSKVFDRLFISMIKAGETGGSLDEVMLRLANTLEKQVELRRKIKSAMTYPIAVLVLVLVILTAMMLFVVPTFQKIFATLHGTLPLPTRILLVVSHLAVKFFPLLILAYVGGAVGFVKFARSKRGRDTLDRLVLKVPIFGMLARKSAMVRFSRTMATLLRSGVPILEALEITKEASGNVKVADGVTDMQVGVRFGEPMSKRLVNHPIFPPMVTQMVAVGEESGSIDTMLDKVALFYEQEVEAIVGSLASLLEPILIVILGSVVGSMIISLYLPMFNVIKLIK